MHTLNKLSRVFGTNVKTILCNNPNMTLKIQHHLVGSSMSGSWINLKNLDSINSQELTRVFQIMQVATKSMGSFTIAILFRDSETPEPSEAAASSTTTGRSGFCPPAR